MTSPRADEPGQPPSSTVRARAARRTDPLSHHRLVVACIELLDAGGEDGLTVRALSAHLATGRGAIYHHAPSKDDLLAAATDAVIESVTTADEPDDPVQALRALAVGVFDAIDAHPWVGAQLARSPRPAVFRLWGRTGALLAQLRLSGKALPDAGAALVSYVLGASAQYAAGARSAEDGTARRRHLEELAAQWAESGHPSFDAGIASELLEHDDRAQFLAGVDLFLAGVAASLSEGTR